jgi:RNA polymerase sigma-70 factor (ECF subfamily)
MSFRFRSNGDHSRGVDGISPNEREQIIDVTIESLENLSDEDLMARLADGTHDALTKLFERYNPLVLGVARRVLKDEGEAEETLQQVFLDIYKAAKIFDREKASFKVWLLQYAYHRAISRKKQLASKGFYATEELAEQAIPFQLYDGAVKSLRLSSSELEYLVAQLLKTITPRQREVIELTFFHGLTAEEIAAKTGQSAYAVRHNLYRGLHKLRLALLHAEDLKTKPKVKSAREGVVLAYRESL